MSSNDRTARQSVGSEAPGQSEHSALLDALLNFSQGGARTALGDQGEATHSPFLHQQGQAQASSQGLQLRGSLPSFQNLPSFPSLNFSHQYNAIPAPVQFKNFVPSTTFETPGKAAAAQAPLSAPNANLKLNSLRQAIASRDPSESVEDVLSPRSVHFLHSHFQSMGMDLPNAATWGQVQQLLSQPPPASSSLFPDTGGLGLQDSPSSLLSAFPSQESAPWSAPQQAAPQQQSVLERFLASVNLPANETNARITKMAASLILQQQQQQQEQQRLLRQQQIRQLQESFQLHSQSPSMPSFQNLSTLGGLSAGRQAGLQKAQQEPGNGALFASLAGLQKSGLLHNALESQTGLASQLKNMQNLVNASPVDYLWDKQPPTVSYPMAEPVAQVILGQQGNAPQRQQASQGGSEQSFSLAGQSLSNLVAPLTSDAMRRAMMAGGALSRQPAEPSIGASLSQGSVRSGKRAPSSRVEQPQAATSFEEVSAESSVKERKKQRHDVSPPLSRMTFGTIPRAPIFNARVPAVSIPPAPIPFSAQLGPLQAPGIARPAKLSGGFSVPSSSPGNTNPFQLQASSPPTRALSSPAAKSESLTEGKKRSGSAKKLGKDVGRGAEVDKERGETPVKMVRAKRGEATDPHSVAERIRRDRITEKMRQLESLVPARHKVDKASMLEEIIEYVKFMQLQVQVLSIGPQGTAQTLRESLPGGLPQAALDRGVAPPSSKGLSASAATLTGHLQRSPEQAVRFLLEKGLCLVPAHLAANLLNKLPQASDPPSASEPHSLAVLATSPLAHFPSETEGSRSPSAVFSAWEEEEKQAAERKNSGRERDVLEVAEVIALRETEQDGARSSSGLAGSGGLGMGGYQHPPGEGDQLAEIESAHDFNAMSPGLGEGLDLPGFGKGVPVNEEEQMAAMWDSDPHDH